MLLALAVTLPSLLWLYLGWLGVAAYWRGQSKPHPAVLLAAILGPCTLFCAYLDDEPMRKMKKEKRINGPIKRFFAPIINKISSFFNSIFRFLVRRAVG